MKNGIPPSGLWRGYYLYGHGGLKHRMSLNLAFISDGKIEGEGVDDIALFAIDGGFDCATSPANWIKAYVGMHRVEYSGVYCQRAICGREPARVHRGCDADAGRRNGGGGRSDLDGGCDAEENLCSPETVLLGPLTPGCSVFSVDDGRKQSLAWARFEALRSHPPRLWDETNAAQFHEIVTALEEAYAVGLTSFRAPDAHLKQRIVGVSRIGYSGRRRPSQMSDERYCDEQFVQRKIECIVFYFQNLQPPPDRQKFGF
jgi:hypothetical protein